VRQSLADIAAYERKIKRLEKENALKADITMVWMEIVTKKTVFKQLTSILYDAILDVRRMERDLVKRLFVGLGGFAWKNVHGWVGQGQTLTREGINVLENPVCLYEGISVERIKPDEAAITAIELPGEGCEGEMPNGLFLQDCVVFDMSQNLLKGPLPSLSTAPKLTCLNLSGNGLSGTMLSASLHLNAALTTLDLGFNELTGTIPDIFESVPNLRVLNLGGNTFDGELPPSLYSLSCLEEMRLQNNNLTGELAPAISGMASLRCANLSQNQFTGGHNHFLQLENIEILQLNNNCLKGHISSEIYRARKLFVLQMQNNQLSGRLPDEISTLNKLRVLNLSNNKFRGLLPEFIGSMVSLEVLLLGGNNFLGPVPLSLAQLPKLRDFSLFKSYAADWSEPKRVFDRYSFQRIFEAGPQFGIDSVHWDYKSVYGRDRSVHDDETVTLFSGVL
jgi:hypothetical protein